MNVHIYEELLGQTPEKVEQVNNDELHFYLQNGKHYMFYHAQDCCESVTIEDVTGNINDLVGSPLTMAEETTESGEVERYGDTYTYTYYKFATTKGYVTIRWYGTSNGYYSESVDFKEVEQMQFIRVKFLKNGQAAGRAYTYRSPEEVKPGDKVELPGGKHAVVVDEPVDAAWIQAYGADKVKEIIGKVEEKSDGK